MVIVLQITKYFNLRFHPTYWYLLPTLEIDKASSCCDGNRTSRWLCFGIQTINKPINKQQDWSDDEVIRQMKNLEKEVESTKTIAKKVLTYRNKPAAKSPKNYHKVLTYRNKPAAKSPRSK